MTTFAQMIASDSYDARIILKIESIGAWMSTANLAATDGTGMTQFTTGVPLYAASDPAGHWRDYVGPEVPDILAERADPLGGFPELGSLSFSLVDIDDYLTETIRTERAPIARLTADATASATTLTVSDTSNITDTDVIFVGGEALRVEDVPTSTSIDVTAGRGYLGTTALPHTSGDGIYLSTPFLRNRRVDVYVVPYGGTRSDEELVASYAIDGVSWSGTTDAFNVWHFTAKSQLKFLHRAVPRESRDYRTRVYAQSQIGAGEFGLEGLTSVNTIQLWAGTSNVNHRAFLRIGAEILAGESNVAFGRTLVPYRRALVGTKEEEIEDGALATQVFLSEPQENDFRYSPGPTPSEDRASGTWTKVDNAAQLMLIMLLSSAHEADQLELVNYESSGTDFARSNYSSLPPGYGVGLPSSLIDWSSWEDFYQRTFEVKFPNFVLGDKIEKFSELISREFLKPLGAYLSIENGTLKIILPRSPLSGAASVTLGADNFLVKQTAEGVFAPRIEVRQSVATHSASVAYEIGPQGARRTFDSAQFEDTYGQGGYYLADENPVVVKVPAGDASDPDVYAPFAASKLFRFHRPNLEVEGDIDLARYTSLPVGTLASITLNELPNFSTGTRGWDGVQAEMLERELRISVGGEDSDGIYLHARLLGYGPAIKVGRISASANITAVNSVVICTVTANRFTQDDAAGGLPTTDASAFAVDDIVQLLNRDGTDGGGGQTQLILDITGNDITLDGNFGGNLAANKILVYANADDAVAQQTDDFAFFADEDDQTVGTGTDGPWIMGEP